VVEQLFVAPGHELRGIGDRLLAYAEGYAIAERARFALCGTATCSAGLAPRQGVNKLLWDENPGAPSGHLRDDRARLVRVAGVWVGARPARPRLSASRRRGPAPAMRLRALAPLQERPKRSCRVLSFVDGVCELPPASHDGEAVGRPPREPPTDQ
jgi:hypothetical protein